MSFELNSGLSVSAVTLAILLLAEIGLTHALMRWWVRRQARRYEAGAAWRPVQEVRWRRWVMRGLDGILPPLALLALILGAPSSAWQRNAVSPHCWPAFRSP